MTAGPETFSVTIREVAAAAKKPRREPAVSREPERDPAEPPEGRSGTEIVRPFVLLAGLAVVVCVLRVALGGRSPATAFGDGLFVSLMAGALAASIAWSRTTPLREEKGADEAFPPSIYLTGWVVPGAFLGPTTWLTALVVMPDLHPLFRIVDRPQVWALVTLLGAFAGFTAGQFYWKWTTPYVEAEGHEGRLRLLIWMVALVFISYLAAGTGDGSDFSASDPARENVESIDAEELVERMRLVVGPGTPARDYAELATAFFEGRLSRWYPDPLRQRVAHPDAPDAPSIEVVFDDGRVDAIRTGGVPPAEGTIPPTEAAERLGLEADHPLFRPEGTSPGERSSSAPPARPASPVPSSPEESMEASDRARYVVMVASNARYMDDDAAYEDGEFADCEEAMARSRKIVDTSLEELHDDGMTADELLTMYRQFGEDPYVVAPDDPDCQFSAREYAVERASTIASE